MDESSREREERREATEADRDAAEEAADIVRT